MTSARRFVIPAAWLLLVVVTLVLPFLLPAVRLVELQQVTYMAVAVLSLNMLSGMAGQISIGQSAFVGLSAYTTALLVQSGGWSYWAALPASIAVGFAIGGLTGLPALRITGIRLALATLSIAVIFPTIPVKFTEETGGTAGYNVDRLKAPDWLPVADVAWHYWVVLLAAIVVFILVRNVMASRVGRSLIAIRDQQTAAHTVGINVSLVKVLVFAFSGAMCGVVGWMFVVTNQFVSPSDFTVLLSIYLLVGMAIGGAATLIGPIIGAFFLIYAPRVIGEIGASPLYTPIIYGAALILILLVFPAGVGGLLQRLGRRITGATTHPSRRVAADDPPIAAQPEADSVIDEAGAPVAARPLAAVGVPPESEPDPAIDRQIEKSRRT